ncbi:MAG TPA: histidine phosphatase family protein [Gaiellaceae bacterium]
MVPALYLLRHAKSSWADASLSDHDRPLAPRGRRDASRIAKHLPRLGCEPNLVLCSSALRTRETFELVEPALGKASVLFEEALYGATADDLLACINVVPDAVDSLMLIGHNPGLQELALDLASSGDDLGRLESKFPTAAVATLALAKTWSHVGPGDAVLADYVVPKQLR